MLDDARAGDVEASSRTSERADRPTLVAYVRGIFRATGRMAALVVAVNAGVFAYLLWGLGPDLRDAIDGARAVRELHESMLDQDASLQALLLTGEPDLLGRYHEGRLEMAVQAAEAERVLGGEPRYADQLRTMQAAQETWVQDWALVAVGDPSFADDAEREQFVEDGHALFDTYRVAEERLVQGLLNDRESLLDRQQLVVAIACVSVLLLGAGLAIIARREQSRLRQLVVEPIEDLRGAMQRLEDGDLTARAGDGGTRELAELSGSLAAMAGRLARAEQVSRDHVLVLRDRSERQARVLTMARDLAGSLSTTHVVRSIGDHAQHLTGAGEVVVWVHPDADDLRLDVAWHAPADATTPDVTAAGGPLATSVARDRHPMAIKEDGTIATLLLDDEPMVALACPMVAGAQVVGVVEVRFAPPATLGDDMVAMVETLCSHAGTAIEAARLHQTATELSQIDPLTGLFNRRRLDLDLSAELARATRYERPLSFVMIDIDHFKQFNDTFGHQRGDEVLREVAQLLVQQVRASDSVYRYGGEEMSVLLRETTTEPALELAERLRACVESHFAARAGLGGVTISVGVASRSARLTDTPDGLVSAADEALYRAKHAGRNRAVAAGSGS